jgi:hypothetical protein
MSRFLPPPPRKSEKKINCRLIDPHDLGALETSASSLECDPNEHQGNKDGFWFY